MTPNLAHHHPRPEPKPLLSLSRPQIAARVYVIRAAMDSMCDQSDRDGGAVYECYGSMKVALIHLEDRLRQLDALAPGRPLAAAVTSPAAIVRLEAAAADLSTTVRAIAVDSARALAHRGTA
jgi:hypothetical protein